MSRAPSITNLKPYYRGNRNSVAPEPDLANKLENTTNKAQMEQNYMKPIDLINSQSNRGSEIGSINAQSIMFEKSATKNEKSINYEKKHLTEENENESDDEEIIPEDEKWKTKKCFWQMNEQMRIRWDLFVMILATWN